MPKRSAASANRPEPCREAYTAMSGLTIKQCGHFGLASFIAWEGPLRLSEDQIELTTGGRGFLGPVLETLNVLSRGRNPQVQVYVSVVNGEPNRSAYGHRHTLDALIAAAAPGRRRAPICVSSFSNREFLLIISKAPAHRPAP
jgi:hypothetical protein